MLKACEISYLCEVIITLLGSYLVPSTPELITGFRRDTEQVVMVLVTVWARHEQACLATLSSVYVLISDTGQDYVSVCLAAVIEKAPPASIVQARQAILSQAQSQAGEARLVTALSRLLSWLGMWPAKQLHTFVLDILGRILLYRVSLHRTNPVYSQAGQGQGVCLEGSGRGQCGDACQEAAHPHVQEPAGGHLPVPGVWAPA